MYERLEYLEFSTTPDWASLGLAGPRWASLGLTGPHWASLGLTASHCACAGPAALAHRPRGSCQRELLRFLSQVHKWSKVPFGPGVADHTDAFAAYLHAAIMLQMTQACCIRPGFEVQSRTLVHARPGERYTRTNLISMSLQCPQLAPS